MEQLINSFRLSGLGEHAGFEVHHSLSNEISHEQC